MARKNFFSIRALFGAVIFVCLSVALLSCLTYSQRIEKYHAFINANNYKAAIQEIDRIKWLKNPRNEFLYLVEKGLALHLSKEYDSSNVWLEKADLISKEYGKKAGDVAKSCLLSPMAEKYKGQEFEKFLVHYYKILNYIEVGKIDDALVEVRRLTLTSNTLKDKRNESSKKYNDDAFAHLLQGLLYESNNNPNDAFIAYKNALNVFRKKNNIWYGISTPQLLIDAFYRTGKIMHFGDELDYYKKEMQLNFPSAMQHEAPSPCLYLFIESGAAPQRQEEKLLFSRTRSSNGQLSFQQAGAAAATYLYAIPPSHVKYSKFASYLTSLAVSIPYYNPSFPTYNSFSASSNSTLINPILDINALAVETLAEQKTEIILAALGRAAIRMLIKLAASKVVKNSTYNNEEGELTSALIMGIIDIVSISVEKADTRNWQSLPSKIYCMIIPLAKGENTITIKGTSVDSDKVAEKNMTIKVFNNQRPVQIKSVRFW